MEHIDKSRFAHVGESAHDREAIARPSLTFTQDAMRRLSKNRVALVCVILILLLSLLLYAALLLLHHGVFLQKKV